MSGWTVSVRVTLSSRESLNEFNHEDAGEEDHVSGGYRQLPCLLADPNPTRSACDREHDHCLL